MRRKPRNCRRSCSRTLYPGRFPGAAAADQEDGVHRPDPVHDSGNGQAQAPKDFQANEKDLVRVEAIINSMTGEERRHPEILNGSRRLRIARGSGTTVQDVNQLLKQYLQTRRCSGNSGKAE